MKQILIELLLITLLAACGQADPAATPPSTTDPFLAVERAERTAQAAQEEAGFYSRQLTATAEAPILAITSTAAAFAMQQEFSRATQESQKATETAAMTSTAMSWTPTANATSTMVAMQVQAEGTMIANDVAMDNLKVERERTMNTLKAMSWYVVGLSLLMVMLMLAIGQIRKASVFVVPTDPRGNPQPLLVDGIVLDIDRAPNGMMQATGKYLKQLPQLTAERQDMVTHHDQLIDLRTRSGALRRLEANLNKTLPASNVPQTASVEVDNEDLNLPLPHWDLMRDWNGESLPLGFGKTGLITAKSASPHLLISGMTGSGKTRFMLRPVTAAALVKGDLVINLGYAANGFGVFADHPNYYSAHLSQPQDIVPCLQHVYEELKERMAVIGGMDADWEHWTGGPPPRPFVTLLMDELGNMAEDLFFENAAMNRVMWSLIARIGNEGRKVGIRFAAALQDPTSKSMDLRFRRNCTLVSFQLRDQSHSNAFIGSTGAEKLTQGRFMARTDTVLIGGGFSPTDAEILEFLRNRHVAMAEPSRWIDSIVSDTKQIEGRRDAPLPSPQTDEIRQLAESIREKWNPAMSKRAVGRLLGKPYAGGLTDKIDRVIEYLTATTTENPPILGLETA